LLQAVEAADMATFPPIVIPPSTSTVTLSVLNTTELTNLPASQCMEPVYDGMQNYNAPSYSFLIGHETSGSKLIFDLGVAKSWRKMMSIEDVKELTELSGIEVKKDVAEVLEEHRIDPSCITFIVYSHHHYDHVGDPSTFPTSTSIVVGPGFMKAYLPGYPDNPSSEFLYDAEKNKGREIIELNFDPNTSKHTCLIIGGFEAIDFFGDGSFFLLDTPGHTIGHVSALLRTTSDASGESTFVLLGGDIAHHASVFRPSQHFPFPEVISPSPFCKHFDAGPSKCFGKVFTQHHYRYHEADGESLARCTSFGKLCWS
jgi:glyoxylase-like metal-dependent hydrolase (beta-lactamase superfamily II)